ncbi:hypothetical protein D3C80_1007620 [compost metagenome]
MMGDEQGRRREGHDRKAQIGRPEIVAGLLGRVMPAEQGQRGGGDHAPGRQRPPGQASHAGQQHHRRERRRQHQGGEQGRLGRGPGERFRLRRRAIEQIEEQALDQADAEAGGGEAARPVQRGAAGGVVDEVGHA